MSEREDIANSFESVGRSMTGIEGCLLEILTELTDLRHSVANELQAMKLLAEEADRVLQDVRTKVMPTIEHLSDEVLVLRQVRQADVSGLSARIRQVEDKVGIEVTKA